MSNAKILFQAAGQDKWTEWRTVEFDIRRTTYETVRCGSHAVAFQHIGMGHELLLIDGETRVDIWPTSGNEPNGAAPKTKDGLLVVGHYDVKDEKGTYRIYHQRHQKEHW